MQLKLAKHPIHVCEVGVGDSFCAKSKSFWGDGINRVTLVEPNPFLHASLRSKTKDCPNVTLHNAAIFSENRWGWLVSAGILSYLPEVASPINTIFRGKLTPMLDAFKIYVPYRTFNTIDDGTIDLLILGMEGAESMVFETMVSRPHVIILNNHFANDYRYAFPRFEEIQRWCEANRYHIAAGIPDITLINIASYEAGLVQMQA
jgi:hypothetical protein